MLSSVEIRRRHRMFWLAALAAGMALFSTCDQNTARPYRRTIQFPTVQAAPTPAAVPGDDHPRVAATGGQVDT